MLDQYVYFVIIAISTVGYGNPYRTDKAKITILVIIIMTIFIIPSKISKLSDIMQSKSEYARFNYKLVESTPFIILLGTMSQNIIEGFLSEFFNEDHGLKPKHALIIQDSIPESYMK